MKRRQFLFIYRNLFRKYRIQLVYKNESKRIVFVLPHIPYYLVVIEKFDYKMKSQWNDLKIGLSCTAANRFCQSFWFFANETT